jgi:hypothetical protein
MSVAAAQADRFFSEVVANGAVWAIRDSGGFPAPENGSGERAMPFWSLESRARTIIDNIPAYEGFVPVRLTLAEFVENWLPGMEKDGLLAGINWSGERATGYDMLPTELRERLAFAMPDQTGLRDQG